MSTWLYTVVDIGSGPVFMPAQTLYFTLDVVSQMLTQLLWKAFGHAIINAQILFVYKYPPLSMTKYSFTQLSEQE